MTQYDLIAIVTEPNDAALPKGMTSVLEGRHSAILCKPKRFQSLSRKSAIKTAALRQERLETLMATGTVLPVLHGTRMTQNDARTALKTHATQLDDLSDRLKGRVQYQIQIGWNKQEALEWFAAGGLDLLHASDTEALAKQFETLVLTRLEGTSEDICELPKAGDLVANCAVLTRADNNRSLDETIEGIDQIWTDGLKIRQIGPSPAVSFASIGFRRVGAKKLRDARELLGLAEGADQEDIRSARRNALLAPSQRRVDAIREAARLLQASLVSDRPNGPLHDIFVWSEGRSATLAINTLRGAA